ncbi:Gfo/Idh/MocA family protein [Paenibacillus apiarius]|uniref:Gfo/Idh/MocA family oxidoreductase n=1 Tax=Paenibacillus apiarius TaxID=46240 RepID=A0ABT4DUE3_9BACL|nr:Gfo/Idh/MocA family oxidoreductase [Paenibacillus apiarius]MCY9514502.1 Gfo/Idh/MocA family oxidoreductase [Paenibacillus apiarius]MCY9520959.1 Gfo/Idh/MocA family oxidoreductase [Paenibacillus apiarius]MCY9551807.1 Gfo/Idh/MocA family oxidoreductase [Paenibacillus apiarius]MCY9557694.1 Gfo/Idh/MocA family oxidoreductase [Paenibacillus apiarius]MCY9684381.1 Gfo/Idh/MocA family oxidoreductase [Paenibacillus apiarius]
MSKVKVAVVGAGSISEMHFGGYEKNGEAEIVAVCDLNAERAKEKAVRFGAPEAAIYTDYKELVADSNVDAISICTWNNSHAPIAIAALEAGKHVLVEKPLCMTVEEALAVQEAQKKSGKTLQVGYVRRYGTNTRVLKKFIDDGDLGQIYYAKASCLRRLGNPGGWFSDKERSGGGPLIDLGVHVIDLCWYLMGKPKVKSVSGNTYNLLGNRNHIENLSFYKASDYDANVNTVEDMANALIRFENGASLAVDVSFSLHLKQDELNVKLFGDKGGAEVEPELLILGEKHNTILNMSPQIDHLSFDFNRGFQNEVDHFIDCCLGRTETLCPAEDGVEMMKMLCGIYESSAKGTEIVYS